MRSRTRITGALVALVLLVLVGWLIKSGDDDSPTSSPPASSSSTSGAAVPGAAPGLDVKALSTLPREATSTWQAIQRGEPYPNPRDGVVFENREQRLPARKVGYYHEFTVPTPNSDDRGARRLISGSARELYYTGDHYRSFVVVDPGR